MAGALVAICALVSGAVPAVASNADLRALNAVRVASHVPAVAEQHAGPLKAAAEALARQADGEGMRPSDFSLGPQDVFDVYCRCETNIEDKKGNFHSFQWRYRRLGGSGPATAWIYPPGSLAAEIRRRPASSIAVAHPWMQEAAFARTRKGLLIVALAATRSRPGWRDPVIARPDAARHRSRPWVLLPAAARGRARVAVHKPYGYQHVMRLGPIINKNLVPEPVRGLGGAWLVPLADEESQAPLSLAWSATYRVTARTGRAQFTAPGMPASWRRASWRLVNLRPVERALFLGAVHRANKQARGMFSIIDGVTGVSVGTGRCLIGRSGWDDRRRGYWVRLCRTRLDDNSRRDRYVLGELGRVIDDSGLTTTDATAFAQLFPGTRPWARCLPASKSARAQARQVFADQFSDFASSATGSGTHPDPRFINSDQLGRFLKHRWLPGPSPANQAVAPHDSKPSTRPCS